MRPPSRHAERHRIGRIGWLRAAVLGADDGIVSTASLVVGVAASGASHAHVVVTGVAGLVAGAMSMAAGEYVSVHSQSDTEKADLSRERLELEKYPAAEQRELAAIYVGRGLTAALAQQVAEQLMRHDALGAHALEELGISGDRRAQPLQAALASAASFAVGAALPLAVTALKKDTAAAVKDAAISAVRTTTMNATRCAIRCLTAGGGRRTVCVPLESFLCVGESIRTGNSLRRNR